MKKVPQIFIKLLLLFVILLSIGSTAQAALGDYAVLTPLPGLQDPNGSTTLAKYLPGAFNLAIAIAAVLAFVMITFGGIMYATSDAISGKSQGREFVENAIWGLLLVIGAWVILYTINPKILKFDLNVSPVSIPGPVAGGVTTGTPMTDAQIAADALVRSSLPPRVTAYRGPCTIGQITNCVNLNGIKPSVITGLKNLQIACNCDISITGGTEGGHTINSAHYNGYAVDIDTNASLEKQIIGKYLLTACTSYLGPQKARGGYLWEPQGSKCGGVPSSGNHWHVQY